MLNIQTIIVNMPSSDATCGFVKANAYVVGLECESTII